MIRNLIFTAIILFSITIEAQYNSQFNRGGRRNQQRQQPMTTPKQKPPKFNVEMAVGMTFYNIEKVTKKIGIKKYSEKFIVVSSIFKKFNTDLNQVKRINTFLFSEAETKIMRAQKESFDTRDYTMFRKAYKEVTTTFEPIVKIVEEKEKELDKKIEKVLTTKELKKWVKYKKNIKKR